MTDSRVTITFGSRGSTALVSSWDGRRPLPLHTWGERSQEACPFRGYFEFYEMAREFPSFARTCGDPFDWVAYYALKTLYQHYRRRFRLSPGQDPESISFPEEHAA